MNFVEFTVGNKTYNLRLDTRSIVQAERKLGKSPLDVFTTLEGNSVPKMADLMIILHAAINKYNHGIKEEDCYDIYDDYLAEGNSLVDFMNVLLDVFKVSGFIAKDEETEAEFEPKKETKVKNG